MELKRKRGEAGLLHVPMALLMIALATGAIGFWTILHHWKSLVEHQLRLDCCVGQAASRLRETQSSIESMNLKIKATRLAITGSAATPEAIPALEALLVALAAEEEILLTSWDAKRLSWAAGLGCRRWGDWAGPLPELPWQRLPPDGVGPQPLRWPDGARREFFIQARHGSRVAVARVYVPQERKLNANPITNRWRMEWSNPMHIRTSLN